MAPTAKFTGGNKLVNTLTFGLFGNGTQVIDGAGPQREINAKRVDKYVMPYQLQRLRQDGQSWRDAVVEAENAWYPHRFKQQQLYVDTILNAHVSACMQRRKNLTLFKDFEIVVGDTVDEKATKLLKADWFQKMVNYILDANFYGYSLIGLGNMVNYGFPELKNVRRWNISPDRLNLVSIPYALSGLNFTDPTEVDPETGESFYDWTIWVETPAEAGPSRCGYGLLYKVGIYEIYLRHLLGFNADYCELFGQPYRHLKSNAKGPERQKEEEAMDNMGSNGWAITGLDTDLEFHSEGGNAKGFMSYDNFEQRLEKKVSKIILGHADALDSTPGALGAGQGGKDGAAQRCLEEVETIDCRLVEHVMNSQGLLKLTNIGLPIPVGACLRYKNDTELEEIKVKENELFKTTSEWLKTMKEAGYKVPAKWITERTAIPLEEIKEPEPEKIPNPAEDKEVQEAIKNFYAQANV